MQDDAELGILKHFDVASEALGRRDAEALTTLLVEPFEDRCDDETVALWVDFALNGGDPPETDAVSQIFADNMRRVREGLASGADLGGPPVQIAGRSLDFLGEPAGWEDWTLPQYLNFQWMRQIPASRRAAVVGTMRDDGIYAIEWLAHHLALGFDHAFIYTNDNVDGSEHLLRRLAEYGVLTLVESQTAGRLPPEIKAFEHLLQLAPRAREFEWLLFVDSDEFLFPAEGDIPAVIDRLRKKGVNAPSSVVYNWMWQISGMAFARKPGMLMERFPHGRAHRLTKVLARTRDLVSMRRQHVPDLRPHCFVVDSGLAPFDVEGDWTLHKPCYTGGWIAHYWPKSFEEFSLKKARGDALDSELVEYKRPFDLFFEWNGFPTEKNLRPLPSRHVEKVKAEAARLRALPGVAEAEAEVESRFAQLLDRYNRDGGLRAIYNKTNRPPGPL